MGANVKAVQVIIDEVAVPNGYLRSLALKQPHAPSR